MTKQQEKLEAIAERLTRAILTLEELDAAISANNHRVIGARLYELRREIEAAREEALP